MSTEGTADAGAEEDVPEFYTTEDGLNALARFLRNSRGIKTRDGKEEDRRVNYFKGSRFVTTMLREKKWKDEGGKWPKELPEINSKKVAVEIGNMLMASGKFHRSQRLGKENQDKGRLVRHEAQVFEVKGCDYTWDIEPDVFFSNLMTGLVMTVVFSFTLLPIWPDLPRQMLGWLSVTFLIIITVFCTVRLVLFLVLWLLGYDFWIFPNLFDESKSFVDSFKPVYEFRGLEERQGWYRFILFLILCYFVHWGCTQPDEFQGMLDEGQNFVDDLYSGKLLTDFVATHPNPIDGLSKSRYKSLEELLEEEEREKIAEAAAETCADGEDCPDEGEGDEADGNEAEYSEDDTDGTDADEGDKEYKEESTEANSEKL